MASGYADSVNLTVLTETYLDDNLMKQAVLKYATAAARTADAALTSALREGMVSYQDDTNSLYVYSGSTWSTIGPVHGALTSWTPAVVQGATPTLTLSNRTYTRLGRLIIAHFFVTTTSGGTANNLITISLPVTAAQSAGPIGSAYVFVSGTASRFDGQLALASTTTAKIAEPSLGSGVNRYFGQASSVVSATPLANNDQLVGFMMYEAAADA